MRSKLVLFSLLLTTGCSGMSNTGAGALGGGALGAGLGALAAGPHHALAGAAIGGALGAGTGGLIGHSEDQREKRRNEYAVAAANAQAARQMSLTDVVDLSQRGTPEHIIIQQINSTGSVFSLTTQDITYLQDQRVSSGVISYMQQRRYARPVVVVRDPYYPPPPPPVSMGVVIAR